MYFKLEAVQKYSTFTKFDCCYNIFMKNMQSYLKQTKIQPVTDKQIST